MWIFVHLFLINPKKLQPTKCDLMQKSRNLRTLPGSSTVNNQIFESLEAFYTPFKPKNQGLILSWLDQRSIPLEELGILDSESNFSKLEFKNTYGQDGGMGDHIKLS